MICTMAPHNRAERLPRCRCIGSLWPALVGLALLILSGPSLAHGLQVFASVVGDQIRGRAYFVGGHPARGIEVELLDAHGEPVATLTSDQDGRFRVRVTAAQAYRVVARSGDGHRAEWPIAASELEAAFPDPGPSVARAISPSASASSADLAQGAEPVADSSATGCVPADADIELMLSAAVERALDSRLEQVVAQAVAQQLLPLREALAEAQTKTSLRDILGGLGYIAGLAGLGLWWTRRRELRRAAKDETHG